MIQKDKWKASQGTRDVLGWSFRCQDCGFKSHVYKNKEAAEAIEDGHITRCPASDLDLTNVTVINQKAVSKARFPV